MFWMKLLWPEMGCPWMKNGWSEIYVLDEKHTCGAGYRMFRMNFFGAWLNWMFWMKI
jgi:hypothetical protein